MARQINMSKIKSKDAPGLADKLRRSEKEITLRNESADVFLTIPDDEMYNEVLKLVLPATESAFGAFGYLDEHGGLVVPSMAGHIPSKYKVQKKTSASPVMPGGIIAGAGLSGKERPSTQTSPPQTCSGITLP